MFDKSQNAAALTKIFGSTDVTKQGSSYIKDRVLQARDIMKPFVLRRLKENVLQHLPKKTSLIEQCDMDPYQKKIYQSALEKIKYKMENNLTNTENKNNLMHLRKISTHPALIRSKFNDEKLHQICRLMEKFGFLNKTAKNAKHQFEDLEMYNDFELNDLCKSHRFLHNFVVKTEDLVLTSGKFQKLDQLLPKIQKSGNRALIFSQFTMLLDVLEEYLEYKNYKYLRLDGATPVQDRLDLIDKFNKNNEIFLFILSTKAGGLGINLTAAQTVIIHDLDMNPYNDKQAEDRCHRFGQTKEVDIYRLLSKQTVDISIFKRATAKLKLESDMTKRESEKSSDKSKKNSGNATQQEKEKDMINESEIAEMMRKLISKVGNAKINRHNSVSSQKSGAGEEEKKNGSVEQISEGDELKKQSQIDTDNEEELSLDEINKIKDPPP